MLKCLIHLLSFLMLNSRDNLCKRVKIYLRIHEDSVFLNDYETVVLTFMLILCRNNTNLRLFRFDCAYTKIYQVVSHLVKQKQVCQ